MRAHAQTKEVNFAEAVKASEQFRKDYAGRLNLVKAKDMPFERSPDGLIKHIINEKMDTKECRLDIYMQFLPPGKASAGTGIFRRGDLRGRRRAMICTGT